MKYTPFLLLAAVCMLTIAQAQTNKSRYLDELIASENAFAQSSTDFGVKKAFLRALDTNSVNFSKQKPVNGYQLWLKRPDDAKGSLYWYPANASISAAGDLGFTMGPAISKPHIDSAQSFNSYFFSAWKRNTDGKLKVVLDGGCRRPAGTQIEPQLLNGSTLTKRPATQPSKVKTNIEKLENDFITEWNADAALAYQKYMADSSWALRPGKYAGKSKHDNMALVVNPKLTQCQYTYQGGEVAKSNDLAYAYGTVTFTAKNNTGTEQQFNAFYVRIWQKLGNEWKIVGDMLSY